jgi:hypothetical protein
MVWPSAIAQLAVQQSPSAAQASPGCTQNDDPSLQCFESSHRPEQQSPLSAHSLPAVLQLSFNAVQVWSAPHTPPQHSALLVHALPSEVHALVEHAPSTQLSEQHSVATLHALPAGVHAFGAAMQPVCESQSPEQQSAPLAHDSDTAWQSLAPAPPEPVSPEPMSPVPLPARELPELPASDAAPVPAAAELGLVVEPPQPTHTTAEAISSAPRTRRGRVMACINGSLLEKLRDKKTALRLQVSGGRPQRL